MKKDLKGKRKLIIVHRWSYRNRPAEITQSIYDKSHIHLEYGLYHPIDLGDWDLKKISRVQKNLRQFLYNHLAVHGYRTNSYILKVEAPATPKGSVAFISLQLLSPSTPDVQLDKNQSFCELMIDKLYFEMEKEFSLRY